MKKLSCLILLLLSALNYAQTEITLGENDKLIYLDSTWIETSKENHEYYRIVKDYYSDKDLYKIYDFYKSGVLQKEGTSITKEETSEEGEFIFYYENGRKKSVTNYIKSRPNGKCYEWYENGNKKLEGEYIEDQKTFVAELKVVQFWNSKYIQTVIDGSGDYEEVDEKFFASGKIKDGFKDGFWQGYDKKLGYTFSENYENKKIISGVSIDSNKVTHNYKVVELRPEPKKGMIDFYKHVSKNFIVPDIKGLSGKIIVGFTVDKNGEIMNPKILKSIGYGTDEEAIKIVTTYKNFVPGEIRGIKTKCTYTLPITIQSSN